jgi:ADP-dependent NAD(P)H-hydrate dehydratase / NAD(P)H-hydrate epimerase
MSHSLPILTNRELRDVESRCAQQGITDLMQRAGLAAAETARRVLNDTAKSVLVLAGPGNNGGDAFEVACHLKDWFFRVTVFYAGDPARLPPDAKRAHAKWLERGGAVVPTLTDAAREKFGLIVDGLFGIGLKRAPDGIYADAIEAANHFGTPILSLDVPSGIDADTGAKPGAAIRAARTITFIGLKPGLLTLAGTDYSGEIELAGLDIAKEILGETAGHTVGTELFSPYLKPRRNDAHKGDMGSVAIIGGAAGMTGAVLLAGRAALKLGAGRVYCGFADEKTAITVDPCQLELMLRPAGGLFAPGFADSMVVGPGLGHASKAHRLLLSALSLTIPLVLDADALNLIATEPKLARKLASREHPALITPHPGEAARLLGTTIAEVQADRIASAIQLARRFKCVALLKGAGSVIATTDGRWFINTTGNPGMASAGMGDVLSGLLGTLLAQGWAAESAMLAGVHLHACAADACVAAGLGPAGLTASEVTDSARTVFNRWCLS